MTETVRTADAALTVAREQRAVTGRALAADARPISRACLAMARRFRAGGTLLTFGAGESCTDAQHIAVEFLHPVIVGKRALPAIALPNDAATMTGFATAGHPEAAFAHALRQLARPGDIALGVASDAGDPALREALRAARDLGLLTVALLDTPQQDPPDVDHVLWARSGDPRVVKESHVTIYHILWELVHVLLDQPGVLDAEDVT